MVEQWDLAASIAYFEGPVRCGGPSWIIDSWPEWRRQRQEEERRNELKDKTFSRSKPWQLVTACRPHKLAHANTGYESLDNAVRAAYASARCIGWNDAALREARDWLRDRLRRNQVIVRWNGEALNEDFEHYVADRYCRGDAMDKHFIPRQRFYECTEHNPKQILDDLWKTMGKGDSCCETEEKDMEEKPKEPTYGLAKEILKKVGQCFAKNQVCECPRTMSHSVDGNGTAMMCLSEEKAMIHFTASAAALERFAKSVQVDYIEDLSNPCNPIIVGYVHWLMRLEMSDDMDGSYDCELKFPKKSDKRFQGFFAGYMWKKGG